MDCPREVLPTPGGPTKTQNRRLDLVNSLLNGKIFQNTFLDSFQSVVIVIQNFFRIGKIVVDFGLLPPGRETSVSI